MAGHSTTAGFRILGDVPTEAVETAVREALMRLKAGEHDLAVHPNCGTNFVTAGIFSGLAGALTMLGVGQRRRLRDSRRICRRLAGPAAGKAARHRQRRSGGR